MTIIDLKMKRISFVLLLVVICFNLAAQKESNDVRAGNKYYKAKKYTEAEVSYRKGLLKNPKSFEANYNLGNALYKQGKYTDALEQYKSSVALEPKDKMKLAAALHNTGNSLLTGKKIEESIAAYKNALKANPKDNDTRYNLAYAQAMLKKQQQDKNKNKDDKKKQDKKDQKKDQNKDNQKQKNQQQQQQPQMSKENAQQILDALMQDEKNTLEKAKKQAVKNKKSADKDW